MNEIVCAHRWGEEMNYVRGLPDGSEEPAWSRHCRWCGATWYDNRPMPRIVTGLIEQKPR